MPTPMVIDLSHHNVVPESFAATKAAGIVGIIHKATEGTSYVDDKVEARRYLAMQAGLLWGVYHFVRPGSMSDQVEHFLRNAPADQNSLYALDHEDPAVSLAQAQEFMELVEAATGLAPVLYSGHVLKKQLGGRDPGPALTRFRLWLAHYTASEPTLPPGWADYYLWQWTDQGSIPGVNPPTDLNAAKLSASELAASWSGGTVEPIPPLEPEPAPQTINLRVSFLLQVTASGPIRITAPEGVEISPEP